MMDIDIKEENRCLRMLLWLQHDCPNKMLYGDDGEMQCNACLTDFKRDSVDDIEKKIMKANGFIQAETKDGIRVMIKPEALWKTSTK